MRVLVTGATGLLGSRLVPFLRSEGVEVVSHARSGGADESFEIFAEIPTLRHLERVRADIVLNLAAMTSVDGCESDPNAAYISNVRVVEVLERWVSLDRANRHLIQVSTDHVYDGQGPHVESDVTVRNSYAFSKYAGELAALRGAATILRTNFVGRSVRADRTSLSDWLFQSVRTHRAITVFEDVLFSPLSITTLSEMIVVVLRRRLSGVFNLGSRQGISKADFAAEFVEQLGLDSSLLTRGNSGALQVLRPKDMRMNSELFEKSFDVRLPRTNDEIGRIAEEYRHAGG